MLQSDIRGKRVFRKKAGAHQFQRIVASRSFYGAGRKRFDVIVVKNEKDLFDTLSKNMFFVWIFKKMCFPKFPSIRSTRNLEFENEKCCCADDGKEYRFVQYFEILINPKIKLNQTDTVLNYFCFRYQRSAGVVNKVALARKFGLVPVDRISRVARTFRRARNFFYWI